MSHCLTFLIIKISRDGKRCPRFLFSICEIRILSENAKAVMQTRSDDLIYIAGIITYLTVIIPCDWIFFFCYHCETNQFFGLIFEAESPIKGSRQKELDDCVNDSDVIGIISYPLQHNRFHLPPVAVRNSSSPELDASNFI